MILSRKITSAALLCSIILSVIVFQHITKTISTGMYSSNELELVKDNNEFVLKLEERQLKLSKNLYEQINLTEDTIYEITYSYGLFNVYGGKVEHVENVGYIEG